MNIAKIRIFIDVFNRIIDDNEFFIVYKIKKIKFIEILIIKI